MGRGLDGGKAVNGPNGNHPGRSPLTLSAPQRAALLRKIGIADGWVLMSVAEMMDLKKNMEGCQAENDRLNKQTARILARQLVYSAITDKALRSARALLAQFSELAGNFAYRADALKEVANLDEALSVLPTPQTPEEKKEETPNG
jgi:hypothetical protein